MKKPSENSAMEVDHLRRFATVQTMKREPWSTETSLFTMCKSMCECWECAVDRRISPSCNQCVKSRFRRNVL